MSSNIRFRLMKSHSKFFIKWTRSDEASKNYCFDLESAVDKNNSYPTHIVLNGTYLKSASATSLSLCLLIPCLLLEQGDAITLGMELLPLPCSRGCWTTALSTP